MSEIDAIRTLLTSKPRPVGWGERRERHRRGRLGLAGGRRHALETVDLGGVPGEWSLAPGSDASRVLLFFHGGGYCSGSIVSHRRMVTEAGPRRAHAHARGRYRLAPEHPFPAAHEDALTAWRFLRGQGIAARAHRGRRRQRRRQSHHRADQPAARRRRGRCPPAPGSSRPGPTSPCRAPRSRPRTQVDPLIHKPYLEELASAYAPPPIRRKDPLISPLFADLNGFPPTLIQVGSAETLLDDAVRFARAAGLPDVAVTLEVWPHMIHAWPMWNAKLAEGRQALEQAGAFMRRWVHS